jgi:hypothetical protein
MCAGFAVRFSPATSGIRDAPLIDYLLTRIEQIDERELVDPCLAQLIFLLKHREELSELVDRKLVPKVLQDIDFILKKGWGKHIAGNDFNHVHVCGVTKTPLYSLDKLVSEENIRLLYHTVENDFLTPDHTNRNIISSLKWPPIVIPIHLDYHTVGCVTVFSNIKGIGFSAEEIGLNEYGKICFEESERGPYRLNNGVRLDMKGVLEPWLFPHIKLNRETCEVTFEGRTIGAARKRI